MFEWFFRRLADQMVPYYMDALRQECQDLCSELLTIKERPMAPEWRRQEGSVKTSPGAEYEIFSTDEPAVFQCYFDVSKLLALDRVLFTLHIRLREGDNFLPYFTYEFTGEKSPTRTKRKIPKEQIFWIPKARGPAGIKMTIEQTAGLSRPLYYAYYVKEPDVW